MSESHAHRRAKAQAAGRGGTKEKQIKGNRRLDAQTTVKATEVERSGSTQGLKKAISRLKSSHKPQKVLQVPQEDMAKAIKLMKERRVSGTVKNMSGTRRRSI